MRVQTFSLCLNLPQLGLQNKPLYFFLIYMFNKLDKPHEITGFSPWSFHCVQPDKNRIVSTSFGVELRLQVSSGILGSHLCCSDLTCNPSVVWVTAEIKRVGGNLRLPALSEHFLSKRRADWLTTWGLWETTEGILGEEWPLCPGSRWDASPSLSLCSPPSPCCTNPGKAGAAAGARVCSSKLEN